MEMHQIAALSSWTLKPYFHLVFFSKPRLKKQALSITNDQLIMPVGNWLFFMNFFVTETIFLHIWHISGFHFINF